MTSGAVQRYAEQHDIPYRLVNRQSLHSIDPGQLSADLLVAVSFGLFIPPIIIRGVPYSVNVHPSLLPKYRGPAPIHNALFNGDKQTGVSLQTISPDAFDKGIIFDQSTPVSIGEDQTLKELWEQLAQVGADMLVNCIRHRKYMNPKPVETLAESSYARPINKTIDWHTVTADQAVRLGRMFDPLTGAITLVDGRRKDIVVSGIHHRRMNENKLGPGSYYLARYAKTGDKKMVVVCEDKATVWVDRVKVSGRGWISGEDFVASSKERFWGSRFVPWRREFEDHDPKEFEY